MDKITTNSSREGETLSLRLKLLHQEYHEQENIWDIGCDHGLLGLSFAKTPSVKMIHLVDPSLPVIETLKTNLKDSYITKPVFIHHLKGQDINLSTLSNCIFIAGMGGKEIGEIVQSLLPKLSSEDLLVLSPHRKILEMRALMHELPLSLVREKVIEENNQFYQVITLKPQDTTRRISLFGEDIWKGEVGEKYRTHQIKAFSAHKDGTSENYVEYLSQLRP